MGRTLNSGRGLVTSNLDTTTSAGWADVTTNSQTSSAWDAGNSTSGWVEFQWDFDPVKVQSIPTYVPHQHVEEVMPDGPVRRELPPTDVTPPPVVTDAATDDAAGGALEHLLENVGLYIAGLVASLTAYIERKRIAGWLPRKRVDAPPPSE